MILLLDFSSSSYFYHLSSISPFHSAYCCLSLIAPLFTFYSSFQFIIFIFSISFSLPLPSLPFLIYLYFYSTYCYLFLIALLFTFYSPYMPSSTSLVSFFFMSLLHPLLIFRFPQLPLFTFPSSLLPSVSFLPSSFFTILMQLLHPIFILLTAWPSPFPPSHVISSNFRTFLPSGVYFPFPPVYLFSFTPRISLSPYTIPLFISSSSSTFPSVPKSRKDTGGSP